MLKIIFDRETRTASIEMENGKLMELANADLGFRVEFHNCKTGLTEDGRPYKTSVILTGIDVETAPLDLPPPAEDVQLTEASAGETREVISQVVRSEVAKMASAGDLRPLVIGKVAVVGNYQLREFLPQERLISAGPRREV